MKPGAAAALLLAIAATPAAAQADGLLDCASLEVSVAFREKVADAMLAPESAETDALFAHLGSVARTCATRFALDAEKTDAYFAYAVGRLPHDAYIGRLARMGVPAALIDEALDFGPGRANPMVTGAFSPAQSARLAATLSANGLDLTGFPPATWETIGAYAAATSQMWDAQRRLR